MLPKERSLKQVKCGWEVMDEMQYRDVVIHTNAGIFSREQEFKKSPPVQQRISPLP